MSRLIDADAMIDGWIDGVNEPIYSANDVIDDIDEQPTVDAVEVVRCKNCEYYKKLNNTGYCLWNGLIYDNDAFCSHGERKGGAK